jgi:methyl-accepting chemotaxis protein
VAATQVIAQGDLTHKVEMDGRDEISDLCHSLEAMQASLRHIVHDVRESTDSIKVASDEVAVGSQDLSHRTENAASSLQETASTMEQISGTIRNTADAARMANQLAASAAQAASHGGTVVSQVVATMDEITDSSRRISDIIGVIDGIAFQTNILALNAAVEAARAGEQGRGFAVVAGEVRALAQRAAGAAKEIKTLINASSERVGVGAGLVHDAGASMSAIVDSVQRVADIIGEITSASTEQSDGIGQINLAVSHLDSMTQQNAALVEQSAAAAESLKDQAAKLSSTVSVFKLS